MSQIFGTSSFEDRLANAFRGDAGEQKKRQRELRSKRVIISRLRAGAVGQKTAQDKLSSPSSVGSNVFKSNLGGTNR